MNVDGVQHRSIALADDGWSVEVIDQTRLPHEFVMLRLTTLEDAARAIETMIVRGAPLIGATAAWGIALATRADPSDQSLDAACTRLAATRPTAVNLRWAIETVRRTLGDEPPERRHDVAVRLAQSICDEDVAANRAIGTHGLRLLETLWNAKRERDAGAERLDLLTHCNAGWLATVDWGTALAPIYRAHDEGLPVHVWVDETRPRNQGAGITAWELQHHGVPHTVVVDNAGGHLMQHGLVDACITGTDRTAASGDVCNKIGTYLKALAARDNGLPFYVALPGSTIDWTIDDGVRGIPIEERDPAEVSEVVGRTASGRLERVTITPHGSRIANYAFDVTPARYVTALITERGVCPASHEGLLGLFPERRPG